MVLLVRIVGPEGALHTYYYPPILGPEGALHRWITGRILGPFGALYTCYLPRM